MRPGKKISMKMDLRYGRLETYLNFFFPGMPAFPSELWLVMVSAWNRARLPWSDTPSLGLKDHRGEAIQSIEVAVIREFTHSTSFRDDTSLNSLSTQPPLAWVSWCCEKLFHHLSLCMNFHAAPKPLVTFSICCFVCGYYKLRLV